MQTATSSADYLFHQRFQELSGDNNQVLIIQGIDKDSRRHFEIYDFKNGFWYPYYEFTGYEKLLTLIGRIGKDVYSIGTTTGSYKSIFIAFDLEKQLYSSMWPVPSVTNSGAISGEVIYFLDDERKLLSFNTLDWVQTEYEPMFTRYYTKRNDQAFLTCNGDVYGFSHYISECYKRETNHIHRVRIPATLPAEFRATSLSDRIYFTNLHKCYDSMHIYTPRNDSWEVLLPKNKRQLSHEHFTSEMIVHDEKLVSINNDRQILIYDPTKNEWDFLCAQYFGKMIRFTGGVSTSRHLVRDYLYYTV